jgi:hypothetical protein
VLFDGTTGKLIKSGSAAPYMVGGTDVPVADGGTGASDAAGARTNLGLVIGTNVQAYHAILAAIAALAVTDGNFIVGNGSTFVAETPATARTSLGLGALALLATINNAHWSGTDLSIANGGTGASTADDARTNLGAAPASHGHSAADISSGTLPLARGGTNATDAAGARTSLGVPPSTRAVAAGTGMTGGGDLSADRTIAADIASQAEAEAGASSTKLMTPQRVAQAIAAQAGADPSFVSLTDAATIAVDWTAADQNFTVTLAGNRTLGLPTNGIPGTWRHIRVIASGSTRNLTLATNYRGENTILAVATTIAYLLRIYCHSATAFVIDKQIDLGAP